MPAMMVEAIDSWQSQRSGPKQRLGTVSGAQLLAVACFGLAQAAAEEMRFASWPEVIAMIPCDRIGRDVAGGLVVLGPINVEEKHFSVRAVASSFEATEIRDHCFKGGMRPDHRDAFRPYYPYRYGHPHYYSPGPFLLPEPPGGSPGSW